MPALRLHPVGRFPLKRVSTFFPMQALTYLKHIYRGVRNLAGSLAGSGTEWCRAVRWQMHISTKDGVGGPRGKEMERLRLLTSHPGGKAAAVAGCSAATPVIGVCTNKISSDGVNLPSPLASDVCRSRRYIFYYKHNDWCFSAALRDEWC